MRISSTLSVLAVSAAMFVAAIAVAPFTTAPAYAATASCAGDTAVKQLQCGASAVNGDSTSLTTYIKNIVNMIIFIVGAIAVLMIVIGAARYVTSNGDTAGVTSAKNTIMYAVIGLIVAVMAYSIVGFVVKNIDGGK